MGTLNLCLKMPEEIQKTRNQFDPPGLRKGAKIGEKWPILILVNFLWGLDVFLTQDDQINS